MASKFQQLTSPVREAFGQQKETYNHTQYAQLDVNTAYQPHGQSPYDQVNLPSSYHPYYNTQYEKYDATSNNQPYNPPHDEKLNTATSNAYPINPAPVGYSYEFPQENTNPPDVSRKMQRFQELQRLTGMVFGVADVGTCILTVVIEATMLFMLVKFYQTRNIPAPDRLGPWSKNTQLWPTYLVAATAFLTFLLAIVGLVYFAKKKAKRTRLTLKVVRTVIHIASWIMVVAFYRIAKTGTDLWGWSCSEKAAAIQQYYSSSLDFDRLCTIQTATWALSLSEVAIKIVLAIVGFYFQFKLDGVKRDILKDIGETAFETYDNIS